MSTSAPLALMRPTLSYSLERLIAGGIDPRLLLEGSGLDELSYQQPQTLLSRRQELRLYRNMLALAASPTLGLELGRAVNVNSGGLLGALVANARDLRHAGYLMRRYHLLISPWFESELIGELVPGQLVIRYRHTAELEGDIYRLLIDRDVRGAQVLLAAIFGAAAERFVSHIAFGYARPPQAEAYPAEFGCPVTFGHDYTYVTFDNELAGLVNQGRCGFTYNILLPLCRDALSHYAPASWQRRVLNVLSSKDDYPMTGEMAQRLNCSERSLRRYLQEEGLQYSELVDRVRFDRARYLLRHSRDSVKTIGFQLGYSEPSNFVHAFTRWAQLSPTQYRRLPTAAD